MAAEVTPATQDDGATPTVTPIADVEMYGACLQDRSPYHKTRCSIPHNGPLKTDNETSSSASSAKASKPTGVFGKTTDIAVQTSLDQQPHLHHYHGRSSQSMLPISATNVLLFATFVRNTRLWAISETCITSSKFRFTVPGFDVIQHPATGPGRRGIALGIPSCFGGHEHGSAVGTMILAKVPNFTPECLWIVGSVYVGHSGATTNYSRREAFASIRQALDRVVPFDNNHPVLIFGDWNTDPQRLQRIVHSWGHGLTVMQFSGSQITRLSTVHGRRHSSIDHFVCNAPARALLTSPRVDRQTAVADHFVIRTSIRAEAQGQPPVLVLQQYPAITVSKQPIGLLHPITGMC
ncbi:hypothetical protein BASA81_004257 [Batrachochytrium salamandrivorans]|nr:hypothetical protein BASA81_004257 [Batrachochytrium salamandrivorans]